MSQDPLLEVVDLSKVFTLARGGRILGSRGRLRAVDGVGFRLERGRTLAIVGESGCGKSTLARLLLRFERPTSGHVLLDGVDTFGAGRSAEHMLRRRIQPVLQDPYGSLNPRRTVFDTVAEPYRAFPEVRPDDARKAVSELLEQVGLHAALMGQFPSSLSGGQRQRVNIARALAARPDLLVLDEPLSALDVSMQAQIVNLLRRLQGELSLTYVFITHDLSLVPFIAERIAVMYLGRFVETGSADDVFTSATHPYSQALLSAVPTIAAGGHARIVLRGEVPDPADPPSGCHFRNRCWRAQHDCAVTRPELAMRGYGHPSACFFPEQRQREDIDAHV